MFVYFILKYTNITSIHLIFILIKNLLIIDLLTTKKY